MFNNAIITAAGLELDTKIRAGSATAKFTYVKLGSGKYDGCEDLSAMTDLKSIQQKFGISSIQKIDKNTVRIRVVTNNRGITEGYYISELGVYAEDPDKGEILYSIALGVADKMDYQPSENELPEATSTFDTFTSISSAEAADIQIGTGAVASAEDLTELVNPEFEDSGTNLNITDFPSFIESIKSKMNIFDFYSNLKAGLKYVLHTGQIINNCVTDRGDLPGSARNDKVLQDQISVLNTNISDFSYVKSNSLSDYDQRSDVSSLRIMMGIVEMRAYISFDVAWIRLQFKFSSTTSKLSWRVIYGSTPTGDWNDIS